MTETSARQIKKYSNRRLYDTQTSSHVTLLDIKQMVQQEIPFIVVDAKTGEDLTRSILMQIIQEAENDGEPIFSSDMLKSIIRFYGPLQGMFGNYLERSITTIFELQNKFGLQSSNAFNAFMQSLLNQYLEQSKNIFLPNIFNAFKPKDQNEDKQENSSEKVN